jgi:phosphatidylglycerophosphate synthase
LIHGKKGIVDMATERLRVSVNPKEFLYISNILSLSRILILPFIVFGLTKKTISYKTFTITMMAIAMITDVLDGYLARRLREDP